MKEIELPSGAKLQITLAPFDEAKTLLKAVLEEAKTLKVDGQAEIDIMILKDLFCYGFSSDRIEQSLLACMKRCLYNKLKIDKDTFEPEEARQDYFIVCFEVAKANLEPFTKALLPKFSQVAEMIAKSQA